MPPKLTFSDQESRYRWLKSSLESANEPGQILPRLWFCSDKDFVIPNENEKKRS